MSPRTATVSLLGHLLQPQPCSGTTEPLKALDSSLKRHTALIKRMRQSLGYENHSQVLKDIESLSLEKYVDEITGAVIEGIGRCKTEKDVWSAVEVRNAHSALSTYLNYE